MAVQFTPLSFVKGDTFYIAVQMEGLNASLTSAYFSVKANLSDDDYVIQKTLSDGIEVDPDNNEVYIVRVDQADTNNVEAGDYFYDLQIGAEGDVFTPLIGRLTIVEEVTA